MARLVTWGSALLTAALFARALVLDGEDRAGVAAAGAAAVAAMAVGATIVVRDPGNRVGWLFVSIGLLPAVQVAARTEARRSLDGGSVDRHTAIMGWFASWPIPVWLLLVLVVLPLTFPDGRLPSRRWRPAAWMCSAAGALAACQAFAPGPLDIYDGQPFQVDNPVGWEFLGPVLDATGEVWFTLVLGLCMAAVGSLFVRYRCATQEVRQQLKWVVAALAVLTVALVLDEVPPHGAVPGGVSAITSALVLLAVGLVPVAAGIAVLRYRLYDLDVVINRVVVHGSLALGVTAVYVTAVVGSGAVLPDATAAPVGLVVAAVTAVALQPLRSRLQRRINVLTFGFRSSPSEAISALSMVRASTVAHEALLARAVEEVAHALRMQHVRLEVRRDGTWATAASYGTVIDAEEVVLPVLRQGEEVGRMILASRSRRVTGSDDAVLAVLCREVGECLQVVCLQEELLASRTALVTAREEERRRIRRDLHDGLGSALTGMILKLQAVSLSWEANPTQAVRHVGEVEHDARATLEDVRRLIYALRPPLLDECGLSGALRSELERLAPVIGTHLSFDAPDSLDGLPAAVEVAAYRIVLEALSNVGRHAAAGTCNVTLRLGIDLDVEVSDDGVGLAPSWSPGVGMHSIRERTEELGGTLSIGPGASGGTCVRVRLPVCV